MVDIYSPLLATALALTLGALVCLIAARVSRSGHLIALVVIGSSLGLIAVAIALVSHVTSGHAPGTDTALTPVAFVVEHAVVPPVVLVNLFWIFAALRLRRI